MTDPRTLRLANEERELDQLASRAGGALEVVERFGSPPRRYVLRLRVRGVEGEGDGGGGPDVKLRDTHDLSVTIPTDYPFAPPQVRVVTPILHLHVWPSGEFCLGQQSGLDEGLADLVMRLARVIQYDPAFVDLHSIANPAARGSYQLLARSKRLPLGSVDLRALTGPPPPRSALVWSERRP